jgi:large subunit ribosomal protein L25
MSSVFEFIAKSRDRSGTSAARVVRSQGLIPAVIYGGSRPPELLILEHNDVVKHLAHEAVYSHVLDINVDGKTEKAVLKAIQRHPAKPKILHIDFMRVDNSHKLKMHVPLHFINEATSIGVKKGGVATHVMVEVEVLCLSSALPEFIAVDLANLNVGESIHLSDIILPVGVEIVELMHGVEHDLAVVSIMPAKGRSEDDDSVLDK